MHTKNPVLDQCGQTQKIKDLGAVSPNIQRAVLPEALVVKPVNLSDLPRFVVASDEGDPFGVSDLEGEEEEEGLNAVESPVYEIAEEKVVGIGDFTTNFEELHQVVELTVDITANLGRILEIGEGKDGIP